MSQETSKQTIETNAKKGMSVTDVLLVGVLLAAGAVSGWSISDAGRS